MKVAIVHYWLVTMRGGENVLEELCRLYPQADIFTHVLVPDRISPVITAHKITTSFISRLPGAAKHYQKYLPLMPVALEQFDLRNYDLVISSESGPAKGVITGTDTLHICYCHTPMRYLWSMYQDYRASAGGLTRAMMTPAFSYLRQWDYASAARVDHFVANSTTVQRRIAKIYRRNSDVIHPPVAVDAFAPVSAPGDFFLYCGQLVAYKRADLALEAFNRTGSKLVVVGDGSELRRLQRLAAPNITFMGRQSADALRDLYARCRALIFPGEEDFGIVPVEAMAAGRPVIAYGKGGVCDSVRDGLGGILFSEQTAECLIAALARFEREESRFTQASILAEAARFSASRFRQEFAEMAQRKLIDFHANGPLGSL